VIDLTPEVLGALGGLGVARRVLGPSLDEVGEGLRRLTERRLANVGRVVQIANKKSKTQDEDAAPNFRAAESILREAMVADSGIVADYLGGVLASARSDGSDDAVAWTSLIGRMSSRELLLHYALYAGIRVAALGHTDINIMDSPGRERLRSLFSIGRVGDRPGLLEALGPDGFAKFAFTTTGLEREGLFEGGFRFGTNVALDREDEKFTGGLEMAPSFNGMNLFMWGHGLGTTGIALYLHPEPELEPVEGIIVPTAYLKTPITTAAS